MHMLRLGFQGVELLTTGRLSLPMREPDRSYLLDVRRGKISEQDCLTRAGELERELADLETPALYLPPPRRRAWRNGSSKHTGQDLADVCQPSTDRVGHGLHTGPRSIHEKTHQR
jgi:hypothetical protein